MSAKIQLRRGSSSEWNAASPIVLASGEPAFVIDTNTLKIGDGSTEFANLESVGGGISQQDLDTAISNLIDSAPETLDTLNEIAAAISDNASFFEAVAYSGGDISQFNNNAGYLQDVTDDTAPQLGGDLDLNNNNIIGTGNITANSGNFDQINFNTSLGEPDVSAGQFAWHENEGTLALGVSDSYAMFVGEELHYRVRNNTGSTIRAGTPVYASGITDGGNPRITVAPYIADGSIREIYFMGLATEDFDSGLNGYTTHFGYIRNIDTRGDASSNGTTNKLWAAGEPAWAKGDILYIHPTVAGKLTKIEPKHSINVAIILNRHENNGKIFVRPTSYGHLDDNHDVDITNVASGDGLIYNSTTELWENVGVPKSDPSSVHPNASGVYNIVIVDSATYSSITKDPNTIYFVP